MCGCGCVFGVKSVGVAVGNRRVVAFNCVKSRATAGDVTLMRAQVMVMVMVMVTETVTSVEDNNLQQYSCCAICSWQANQLGSIIQQKQQPTWRIRTRAKCRIRLVGHAASMVVQLVRVLHWKRDV